VHFFDAFGTNDFLVRQGLIYILVVISIQVLLNAGLFAVPQIGFMGVGAFVSAVIDTRYRLAMPLLLLAATLSGAATGLMLGLLMARLDGLYLAIASIGFNEMVQVTAQNLDLTGGAVGLNDLNRSINDLEIVAIVLIAFIFVGRIAKTRYGLAMVGIREDQLMTSHQGVRVKAYRIWLFTLSGVLAGLAGGLYVHLIGFVAPDLFSFALLTTLISAAIIGGMTRVLGPLIGGVIVFGLPALLRGANTYQTALDGAILVAVIIFAPSGIVDLALSPLKLLRRKLRREPVGIEPVGNGNSSPPAHARAVKRR